MITVTHILLAFTAVGLITELIAAARAPFGYQDASGFHFGREHAMSMDASGCGNLN